MVPVAVVGPDGVSDADGAVVVGSADRTGSPPSPHAASDGTVSTASDATSTRSTRANRSGRLVPVSRSTGGGYGIAPVADSCGPAGPPGQDQVSMALVAAGT